MNKEEYIKLVNSKLKGSSKKIILKQKNYQYQSVTTKLVMMFI